MMAPPPKVVIMGQLFDLTVHKKKAPLPGDEHNNGALGTTDLNRQVISVRSVGDKGHHVGTGTMRDTVLHEALHGLFYLGDLEGYATKRAGHHAENLINALSTHLLALLRDNPSLVSFLMEED